MKSTTAECFPTIASCKRPSEIILLDALPATPTGKILKHKLAERLRECRLKLP